jgi:hypothetical protein
VYRERVQEARSKAVAHAREMASLGDGSACDFKANYQLRASKGAGYVAKTASVSGIVNAINAAPTSPQRVEALCAALAQTDVRATALSAGVVSTLEAGSMVADAFFYRTASCARGTGGRPRHQASLTLVVPSHMVVYVGINLESPSAEVSDGWPSPPAVHVHDDICNISTHARTRSDRRGVSRARSRACLRRLRVDFDFWHSRTERSRRRLRFGVTSTDVRTAMLAASRLIVTVLGS